MSSKQKNGGRKSPTEDDITEESPIESSAQKPDPVTDIASEAIEDEAIIDDAILDDADATAPDPEDAEIAAEPDEDVLELTQGDSRDAATIVDEPGSVPDDDVTGDDIQDAAEDVVPEPAPAPASPPPPPAEPSKQSSGFMPAFLGGLVAAGLGIGLFLFLGQGDTNAEDDPVQAALEAQATQIAALDARLTEISDSLANTGQDQLRETISGLSDQVSAAVEKSAGALSSEFEKLPEQFQSLSSGISDLGARLATLGETTGGLKSGVAQLEERLSSVEKRPLVESSETAKAAFSAYERELERLKESLKSQQQQNTKMADELSSAAAAAKQDISSIEEKAAETRAKADEANAAAEARAQSAASREAVAELARAIDTGTPFTGSLTVLEQSQDVPDALKSAAETGVTTLPALQASFPGAARAALDASIKTTMTDEPSNRIMSFLRAQTGARSLEPREGDDPDAILSRAEAAVTAGDIDTALQELSALPEAGTSAMADWVAQAQARQAAKQASGALSASVMSE